MFKPDPPPRSPATARLIPPDWFVAGYNANRPWPSFATALDPQVMALWHMISFPPPPPSALTIITGI